MALMQKSYSIGSKLQSPNAVVSSTMGAAWTAGKTTGPMFAQVSGSWTGARRGAPLAPMPLGGAVATGYAGKTKRPTGKYL